MADAVYPKFKERISSGNAFNWGTDAVKVALVTSGYVYSATHQFLSDVGANRKGTDQALGTKSNTSGKLTCGVVTWSQAAAAAPANGDQVAAFVFYVDTGSAATSPLIKFEDTPGAGSPTPLPFTAVGGDVTYTPDATNGVVQL